MKDLFDLILDNLSKRFHAFAHNCSTALEHGDRTELFTLIAQGLLTVLFYVAGVILIGLILYLGRRIFIPLFGGLFFIWLMITSYRANRADEKQSARTTDKNILQMRTESVYECLRDAIYLILREAATQSSIVLPTSKLQIENDPPYKLEGSYAIFFFTAQIADEVDVLQIRDLLNRLIRRMVVRNRLPGIPATFVSVNGALHPPFSILDIEDFGASLLISVVFINQETLPILESRAQLERSDSLHTNNWDDPDDDEF